MVTDTDSKIIRAIKQHQAKLEKCTACPKMQSQPVVGQAVNASILLIGQAPGIKEKEIHKPFAWTAGKTLFKWFASIGVEEDVFREQIYMAAVCRCFPGKKPTAGDRVPDQQEIDACAYWLKQEVKLLQPLLIIPVGKLAISQMMEVDKLDQVIGKKFPHIFYRHTTDIIPLPHPSGASTWHRREPGISLLDKALKAISRHKAWQDLTPHTKA